MEGSAKNGLLTSKIIKNRLWALWGSFGVVWGSLGRPWEGSGETLGGLWEPLGRLWEAFGRLAPRHHINGMVTSPFYLMGNGDGMATSPINFKGEGIILLLPM